MEEDDSYKKNVFQDMTGGKNEQHINDDEHSLEADVEQPTEVESLCVSCGENGITTLLLAKIPHYSEVIVSSFACESCGFRNNDLQRGSVIQAMGVTYKVFYEQDNFGTARTRVTVLGSRP